MQLTTLVIDDSKMQNLFTTKQVKEHPALEHVGSFTNPKEGLKAIDRLQPDVVILDVEMPELDGFGVLNRLNHDCQVILYSTREQFALDAFQYDQVKDYLTKPLQHSRFEKSILKVQRNHAQNYGQHYFMEVALPSKRLAKAS